VREMDSRWEEHVEGVRADMDWINVTRGKVEWLNVVDRAVSVLLL
jgi:hypothetical protein